MTALWGPALDAEVAYRRSAAQLAYPRRRTTRARRSNGRVRNPVRRSVPIGAVGIPGATAGAMAATGRR
jgi:hypothetical protein